MLLGGILLISASLLTLWSTHLLVDCIFEKKSPSCEGIGGYSKCDYDKSIMIFFTSYCSVYPLREVWQAFVGSQVKKEDLNE